MKSTTEQMNKETKTIEPTYPCKICNKIFPTKKGYNTHCKKSKDHFRRVNDTTTQMNEDITVIGSTYSCKICNKTFQTLKGYNTHCQKSLDHKKKLCEDPYYVKEYEVYKYHCNVCNESIKNDDNWKKHIDSMKHYNNIIIANGGSKEEFKRRIASKDVISRPDEIKIMGNACYIPLKDDNGNITDYAIIDLVFKDVFMKVAMHKKDNGHVGIYINGVTTTLHKHIYYTLRQLERTPETVINHINKNNADNRLVNLRELSESDKNRCKVKKENGTSQYYGVYFDKNNWSCEINLINTRYKFTYKNELHAAWHYNILVKRFSLDTLLTLNNIDMPENFILSVPYKKINRLPRHFYTYNVKEEIKYRYIYKNFYYGPFKTLEDAEENFELKKEEHKQEKIRKIREQPIERDEKDQAVIKVYNIKKECVGETIVDDDLYYELKEYTFHLLNGYVIITKNRKSICLSRFITKCNDYLLQVDHINGNTLDNRCKNLRIVTPMQNTQNRRSRIGSTSQYIGVHYNNDYDYWSANITFDSVRYELGHFDTELEAIFARDLKAKEANKLGHNFHIHLS
jgi:hypothetical protein